MSTWTNTITNKGLELLNNSLTGGTINITRVVSGSNSVPITDLMQQKIITNIQQTLTVQPAKVGEYDGTIEIPVVLYNLELEESYYLMQIGIYAEHPEEGEILFAIAQIDTKKEIPSFEESPGYSIEFFFSFKISNSADIEIVIPTGYATMDTVQEMVGKHVLNQENPHYVTKEQVGLGKVPNVATNDQTPTFEEKELSPLQSGEKLSVLLGKISLGIKRLLEHDTAISNMKKTMANSEVEGLTFGVVDGILTVTYDETGEESEE